MNHQNLLMRIMLTATLLCFVVPASALGKDESKTVEVGETFTVFATTSKPVQSVLWKWDTECLNLLSSTSISATFKAVKASPTSPTSPVIIQATVYYYASVGSIATGKFFDNWEIYIKDNSTVTLNETSRTLSPGESFVLRASTSSSSYSGSYSWESSDPSVADVTGSGSSVGIKARASGNTTIKVVLSNGAAATCEVHVEDIPVTEVRLSNLMIEVERGENASMTVYPSNGTVRSTSWNIVEGSDIISVSPSGYITGEKPGKATINCVVNGTVHSDDAEITVFIPSLTDVSSTPQMNAEGVSVFVNPSIKFTHAVSRGDGFDDISLSGGNSKVEGTVEISDREVRFLPAKPLNPLTAYTLSVPRTAIKNKWGNNPTSDAAISFTTADLEKATLEISPESGQYLTRNDSVRLVAKPSDARIYYTVDGKDPDTNSTPYSGPIKVDADFTVKAIAVREGYKNSEIVTGQYYKSMSEIIEHFPDDATPLFNYSWATPFLNLSGLIEPSDNFRRISLTDGSGKAVSGEAFVSNYLIVFVPDAPLSNHMEYTMTIPNDAVKTVNGEVFKGFSWKFTTRNMTASIDIMGDESVFLLNEKGGLSLRGMFLKETNNSNGSYTFTDYSELRNIDNSGIDENECGYTHRLRRKGDTVEAFGMTFCGEGGTKESIGSIGKVSAVRAGFQTSAIIAADKSLWLCGRNDFYQLGNGTGTTSPAFVKVADNVIDVALGNGYTLYVDTDNSMWAVGRNHRGQLGNGTTTDLKTPIKVMDGVAKVFASRTGYFSACITTDKRLMTWGDNSVGQLGRECENYSPTPEAVLTNVVNASLGGSHILATTENRHLYSWGSNAYGQISQTGGSIAKPTVMAEDVSMAVAGPSTSLVLYNNGKVTGWGRITHSNFGEGEGKAAGFVIDEGAPCSLLSGVRLEPVRVEALPGSDFAFVETPLPHSADFESVYWSSDNTAVATVNEKGIVHIYAKGEAVITAKMTDRFGNSKESKATIVCTEDPHNSDISDTSDDSVDWFAYSSPGIITVENVKAGITVTVYNTQGMVIGNKTSTGGLLDFDINTPGLYIIKAGKKAVKLIHN